MTRSFGFGFFCALIDNVHLVDKVHLVDNVHPVNIVQLVDRVQLEAGFRPRDILVGELAQLFRLTLFPPDPLPVSTHENSPSSPAEMPSAELGCSGSYGRDLLT